MDLMNGFLIFQLLVKITFEEIDILVEIIKQILREGYKEYKSNQISCKKC